MDNVIIQNAVVDTALNIEELTTAELNGTGVLDVMLEAMRVHLNREFKENRITGAAYATVYAQSLTAFLGQACAYSLAKSKMALELTQLQAEILKLDLETKLVEAQIAKVAVDTGITIKQGDLINSQAMQTKAETNRINAEVGMKLPVEVSNLTKQGIQISAQTDLIGKQSTKVLAEVSNVNADTSIKGYQLSSMLPAEKMKILAETSLIDYQRTFKIPKEMALIDKQLSILEYELSNKLPKELLNIEAQIALTEQKTITEQAQTTGVASAGSVIYAQNELMTAQRDGFLRDAEQKAAKILVDTWSLRKNTDPDGNPENSTNQLADSNIGSAVGKMLSGIGV